MNVFNAFARFFLFLTLFDGVLGDGSHADFAIALLSVLSGVHRLAGGGVVTRLDYRYVLVLMD